MIIIADHYKYKITQTAGSDSYNITDIERIVRLVNIRDMELPLANEVLLPVTHIDTGSIIKEPIKELINPRLIRIIQKRRRQC